MSDEPPTVAGSAYISRIRPAVNDGVTAVHVELVFTGIQQYDGLKSLIMSRHPVDVTLAASNENTKQEPDLDRQFAICKPGDVVFVRATRPLPQQQIDKIRKQCQESTSLTGVQVVLLDCNLEVAQISSGSSRSNPSMVHVTAD